MITLRGVLSAIIVLICITSNLFAQTLLDRRISIDVTNQRFSDVLKLISSRGNFYFSYNSNIISRDSLITISASNRSVKQVLDQLLGNRYQWQQSNNYIILRRIPVTLPVAVASATPSAEKLYTVTGFVLNGETGEKVGNVTIYEKERLVSTMSDDKGFFKIRLKSRYSTASLTISREMFEDTTVVIQPKYNQQVTIVMTPVAPSGPIVTISPVEDELPDTIVVKPPTEPLAAASHSKEEINRVEKTRWGKRLLTAKQNIQSINLKKFFADRIFQVSLTPGLSTHGKLSSQVVSNFSFNVVGGYTAGVSGVEIGGAFNISKKDVKYMQAAGALNVTGGSVTGVQLAGFHNHVLGNVDGVQASGFSNYTKGNLTGVQASSFHNHVSGSLKGIQASNFSNFIKGNLVGMQVSNIYNICYDSVFGVQAATIANFAREQVSGMQTSVFANIAREEMNGAQIGLIFNYAKKLRGVQIGIINVSDTSDGYSIGLVNIVFKGIHKLAFSTNEVIDYNIAFKTGNKKLYSILLGGYSERKDTSSLYTFGYGLGHEFSIGKWFSINPEFTTQYLHQGSWDNSNVMSKLTLQFNLKLGKYIALFGGPSFSMYYSEEKKGANTLVPPLPASYHTFDLWDNDVKGWFGWNAGISFF